MEDSSDHGSRMKGLTHRYSQSSQSSQSMPTSTPESRFRHSEGLQNSVEETNLGSVKDSRNLNHLASLKSIDPIMKKIKRIHTVLNYLIIPFRKLSQVIPIRIRVIPLGIRVIPLGILTITKNKKQEQTRARRRSF